jgi:hypothetical protein
MTNLTALCELRSVAQRFSTAQHEVLGSVQMGDPGKPQIVHDFRTDRRGRL